MAGGFPQNYYGWAEVRLPILVGIVKETMCCKGRNKSVHTTNDPNSGDIM